MRKAVQGRVGRFVASAVVRCSPASMEALLGVLRVASRGMVSVGGFAEHLAWSSFEPNWGWVARELFGESDSAVRRLVLPEDVAVLIAVARTEPWLLLYYREQRSEMQAGFAGWAANRLRAMAARYQSALGLACEPAPKEKRHHASKYWPEKPAEYTQGLRDVTVQWLGGQMESGMWN